MVADNQLAYLHNNMLAHGTVTNDEMLVFMNNSC